MYTHHRWLRIENLKIQSQTTLHDYYPLPIASFFIPNKSNSNSVLIHSLDTNEWMGGLSKKIFNQMENNGNKNINIDKWSQHASIQAVKCLIYSSRKSNESPLFYSIHINHCLNENKETFVFFKSLSNEKHNKNIFFHVVSKEKNGTMIGKNNNSSLYLKYHTFCNGKCYQSCDNHSLNNESLDSMQSMLLDWLNTRFDSFKNIGIKDYSKMIHFIII